MPLGQGIAEILEAIPQRIEVSGHGPTWRITGASFDAVLEYAEECYDQPTVVAAHRRDRWWPRVTLTVTTDPQLAKAAPPVEDLREQAARPVRRHAAHGPARTTYRAGDEDLTPLSLDEIFESQEERRAARLGIPQQRGESA
jgi:hypothetical protein